MSFAHVEAKAETLAAEKTRSYASKMRRVDSTELGYSPADRILHLQKTIGNHAVQMFILQGLAQAKLNVAQPDDPLEQEADRVAEQVLQTPKTAILIEKSIRGTGITVYGKSPSAKEVTVARRAGIKDSGLSISASRNGSSLSESSLKSLEQRFGYDFNQVRIHTDAHAARSAQELNAQAFTTGRDIFFGAGKYQPVTTSGKRLLAHELTHTIQQGASKARNPFNSAPRRVRPTESKTRAIQLKQEDKGTASGKISAEKGKEVAPGTVELKGNPMLTLDENADKWLEGRNRKPGWFNVKFGEFAEGQIEINRSKEGKYSAEEQGIPIRTHPLFSFAEAASSKLKPMLFIEAKNSKVTGKIGFGTNRRIRSLAAYINQSPDIIGLKGLEVIKGISDIGNLAGGALSIDIPNISVGFGDVFSVDVELKANDEKVEEFTGKGQVKIKRLKSGDLTISRSEQGVVTGNAKLEADFPKNITGTVNVFWDGERVSGEGKVAYAGEKLQGELTLEVMDESKAKQLEESKKAPPKEESKAPAISSKKPGKIRKERQVVFGEGDLRFAFTDWLNGTAHVIVDPNGFATIMGEITPQKELELFPQKDYNMKLFKVEARFPYGVPIVGNIFIFANVGMDAFARLGPAVFHEVSVGGTYSTDPKKCKDFSVKGSLNISAAAGLRLRGEGGVGLEVLATDVKAGVGVNATAEILGYAEATPIIGYREKLNEEGGDKKGEFFIRGDLEIAAEPSLGLSGDIFVEVDPPFVSTKKWNWPLVNKKWPLGSSFGITASLDYVFGSGQIPSLEFKKVDFSAEKFLTDMVREKTEKGKGKTEQKGTWKEKNSENAEPPSKTEKKGEAKVGKPPELPLAQPKEKRGKTRKVDRKKIDPNMRIAEGKTMRQLEEEATQPSKKQEKAPSKLEKRTKGVESEETKYIYKWNKGVRLVNLLLEHKKKTGMEIDELNTMLKSIRKKTDFTELYAVSETEGQEMIVEGSMSPKGKQVTTIKKATKKAKIVDRAASRTRIIKEWVAADGVAIDMEIGSSVARIGLEKTLPLGSQVNLKGWHRAHAVGAGVGAESGMGIRYAPPKVNLGYQNAGIERFIREFNKEKAPDTRLFLRTVVTSHPNSLRLATIIYRISAARGKGRQRILFEVEIEIQNKTDDPKVSVPEPAPGEILADWKEFLAETPSAKPK